MIKVTCDRHGESERTFTCPHMLQTLKDETPRGFHWTRDEENEIQAFCDACWDASDEEWEAVREEGPRLLCLHCLQDAAALNGTEMEPDW